MKALGFLHEQDGFLGLIEQISDALDIAPPLIEKDYWLMHCLWGLQQQGWKFELKGGTSLSKGYQLIHRFSEDIDIRFEPPALLGVKSGKNHDKPAHQASRRDFFDWLAGQIKIPGLKSVTRDTDFDDAKYRNCGILLGYPILTRALQGIKDGICYSKLKSAIGTNLSATSKDYRQISSCLQNLFRPHI
jgi:hypothetical protein